MSKSMEVVIQSLEDRMDLAAKARRMMRAKRLTDAELAAECHAATARVYRLKVGSSRGPGRPSKSQTIARESESDARTTALDQMITLVRFATLPHYDEWPAS